MKTRLCGIDLKSDQKIVELLGSTGNDTSFSQPTFSGVFFLSTGNPLQRPFFQCYEAVQPIEHACDSCTFKHGMKFRALKTFTRKC